MSAYPAPPPPPVPPPPPPARPSREPAFLAALRGNLTRTIEVIVLVAVLLGAIVLISALTGASGRLITAHFGTTIGVYPGSDVRILGVRVGSIERIEPRGTQVKVTMRVDHDVDIPATASAAVLAPNLVSDRYVQLLPAYNGGPKMPEGADIDVSRTRTPLELDQLYESIRRFTTDLGPNGVNARGALSNFIKTGAANFDGNGRDFNNMIADLGKASQTLSKSATDLYATFGNLNRFSVMLRANDAQVRLAQQQLAEVTGFLAADREEITTALRTLATGLTDIKDFIGEHRARIKTNVDKLSRIVQVLIDQRAALAEVLDTAPLVAQNALNAYDPTTRSLMSRGNLLEITKAFGSKSQPGVSGVSPADTRPVCAAAGAATEALRAQCQRMRVDGLTAVPPGKAGTVPPLPLPPAGQIFAGTTEGGR